jgi:sigma-B regulation protein RsbU (phosphoserine phosphatase)
VIFISGEGTRTIRLLTEIKLAEEIHGHLVPAVDRTTEQAELYGLSAPATEVGGDLLDVHHEEGRTALYLADVTGHGVPAGVTMAMVKSAIRMKLRDRPALSNLVSGLNAVLAQTQRPGTLATFAWSWEATAWPATPWPATPPSCTSTPPRGGSPAST